MTGFENSSKKAYIIIRPVVWAIISNYIERRSEPTIRKESEIFAESLIRATPINIWRKYENYDYQGGYCHECGKDYSTTIIYPRCNECYFK